MIYGVVGDMFTNLNQPKSGIPFLEFSIIANPDQPVAYYVLGGTLAKLGRFNRAKQLMERAWELDGKDPEIRRNLGWITAMRGRFKSDRTEIELGRSILKEIIEQDNNSVEAMVDLAQSHLMTQEFDQALSWITQAKKLEPDNEFVSLIYNDVISLQARSENDPNFKDFLAKQKAIRAYSGPEPKDDEEMDEHLAKQFEIEDLINQLNQGGLSQADLGKIMNKLKQSGLVGQITALPADADPVTAAAASEYIAYHQKIDNVEKKFSKEETITLTNELLNGKLEKEKEKEIILKLAHQGTKQALEALEKYQSQAKGDLAVWAKMAINECRAFLNSGHDGPGMFFDKL